MSDGGMEVGRRIEKKERLQGKSKSSAGRLIHQQEAGLARSKEQKKNSFSYVENNAADNKQYV